MSTSASSHKTSPHVHLHPVIDQLVSDELRGLLQSKDMLDLNYPDSIKNLSQNDMWKLALRRVMERLSDPGFNEDLN